ncbi:MAG: hypothetical protein ABI559_12235 [Chloroflexota bacterium]
MRSASRKILAALVCVALAAFVVACGGEDASPANTPGPSGSGSVSGSATAKPSGGPTANPEEQTYFQQLAVIFSGGQARSNAASSQLDTDLSAAKSLDDQKAAIDTFLDTMIAVFQDAADGMDSLDAPADAKDNHTRFRDDVSQAKTISAGLKNDIAGAETSDEATTIIDDFNTRVNALVSDSQAACTALQGIATGDNVDVDLGCTNG